MLAKNFPNVHLDMCWAHIVSPNASVLALQEWIDTVPLNKISAFGGDYLFVDGVYGHQHLARADVVRALAAKVEEGCSTRTRPARSPGCSCTTIRSGCSGCRQTRRTRGGRPPPAGLTPRR